MSVKTEVVFIYLGKHILDVFAQGATPLWSRCFLPGCNTTYGLGVSPPGCNTTYEASSGWIQSSWSDTQGQGYACTTHIRAAEGNFVNLIADYIQVTNPGDDPNLCGDNSVKVLATEFALR